MVTLHIEHAITDFETWAEAFVRFTETRREAGVRAHRVHRPIDDPLYVMVDLDFDGVEAATAFRDFLTAAVWAVPANSPALMGTPRTMLLETAPM